MSLTTVSNLSIRDTLTANLQSQQNTLLELNQALSSGYNYSNLTDYAPSDAQNLVNLQNTVTQRNGYIGAIATVQSRLSVYDATMTDMESVVAQAQQLVAGQPSFDPSKSGSTSALADSFLKSISNDLNQSVNGRYIYSGSRYTTSPVQDLTTLAVPPTQAIQTANNLPDYDTQYVAPGNTSQAAWTSDSVTIDSSYTVQYGVTSNDKTFQQLITGLRYLKAAGQATDSTTYQANLSQANSYLIQAQTNLQTLHTNVANNINVLSSEKDTQNSYITELNSQINDIRAVDLTKVSTEITLLQTQLQASYSATGSLEKLSIVQYL